jgi:hypothetical protein
MTFNAIKKNPGIQFASTLDKAPDHPAEELMNMAPDTKVVFQPTNRSVCG